MVGTVFAMLVVLAAMAAVAYAIGLSMSKRGEPMRDWVAARLRRRDGGSEARSRPIEAIARDLRRLAARYHGLDAHASYAKVEAVRSAYDRALVECCEALGLSQLLGVLAPGPQLDDERTRVEQTLDEAGVHFPHPA